MREIFVRFLELQSLTKVERHLREKGVKTKNGREFSRFTVRQILENPVYAAADADTCAYFSEQGAQLCAGPAAFDSRGGIMAYNKTLQRPREPNRTRAVEEWIVAPGRHEPLVSGRDWVRVQKLLGQNRSPEFRRPRSDHALLSGLLFCGGCGAFMRPKLTQRRNEKGELVYTYLCERKEKSKGGACGVRNVSGNRLDAAVCEQLRRLPGEECPLLREDAAPPSPREGERLRQRREELSRALEEKEKVISEMVFSLVRAIERTAYDYMIKEIDKMHAEAERMREELQSIDLLTAVHPLLSTRREMARELLETFRNSGEAMPLAQRRAALRTFIERVEWDGANMHIYLNGSEL